VGNDLDESAGAEMSATSKAALPNILALMLLLLASWQLLYWTIGEVAMRSPAETISFMAKLMSTSTFWPHLAETAKAFTLALLLAVLIGLFIGLGLGVSRFASDVFEPMLVAVYSIPKITLYPILLLMFGLGISAKVAFGTIHGVVPIALFTIHGVRNVRPVLVKAARTMHLGPFEMVVRVILPAAMPEIFTGLRIGFALTLIGTLLGEMFASQRGLGFLLMNAIGLHNIDLIMSLTCFLTLFAGAVSSVLLCIGRRMEARSS
jgi:NitT/TauT family transport system permease protein